MRKSLPLTKLLALLFMLCSISLQWSPEQQQRNRARQGLGTSLRMEG